jgi:phosphatidate cytidylyltransferase
MLFGTAAGAMAVYLLMPVEATPQAPAWGTPSEWAGAIVFSALLAATGQLGDLAESAIKRWAGVKDSGRLVPEFGGALDMVDGFLISIPVAYLFLKCGGEGWVF